MTCDKTQTNHIAIGTAVVTLDDSIEGRVLSVQIFQTGVIYLIGYWHCGEHKEVWLRLFEFDVKR